MKNLTTLLLALSCAAQAAEQDRVRGFFSVGSSGVVDESSELTEETSSFEALEGGGSNRRRDLKGGSSKSSSYSSCETMKFSMTTADLYDNKIDSENGYSTSFKVYKRGTNQQVAKWFEDVAYTNKANTDGIGSGVITFNVNAAISFTGVLRQHQLPITGGSGKYACATGYVEPVGSSKSMTHYDVHVCFVC